MPFENIFPQPRTQGHFSGTRTSSEIVFYNGKFINFVTYFKVCDTSPPPNDNPVYVPIFSSLQMQNFQNYKLKIWHIILRLYKNIWTFKFLRVISFSKPESRELAYQCYNTAPLFCLCCCWHLQQLLFCCFCCWKYVQYTIENYVINIHTYVCINCICIKYNLRFGINIVKHFYRRITSILDKVLMFLKILRIVELLLYL